MKIRLYQVVTILALAIFARSLTVDDLFNDDEYAELSFATSWHNFIFTVGMAEDRTDFRLLDVANADIDLDGKTSLSEAADLLNALFFKVTPEELTKLDDDHDGYLTNEEVENANVTLKLIEIIDPGTNLRPRADKFFEFFIKHGVNTSRFLTESNDSDSADYRLETDDAKKIIIVAAFHQFNDQAQIRDQLRWTVCCRLLLMKNKDIMTLFNGTDGDAFNTQRFKNIFQKSIVKLDDKDFADTISASDIRNIKVNRWNIFWPTADDNGMFPIDQVKTFWKAYNLEVQSNDNTNRSVGFDIEGADLDQDGFLNAHELHEWLGDSDSALLDEYYVNVMIDGVQLLLKKFANLFDVYLNEKNVQLGGFEYE